VADQHTAKPPASKAVFINCPFDDGFKPIFRAIVFTILSSGYFPRCALDATDGAEIRISKIAEMIGECDWGIHDLSRIEVDAAGVPRFNMPMELGIHLGARLLGAARHKRKRALILEAKPHRYDAALSDISGQDIEVHANSPAEAIRCVRNWLSEHRTPKEPPLPGATALLGDYRLFRKEARIILREQRLDPLDRLSHNDFLFVVRYWMTKRAQALA
jgi:plasmid stabilization system protein ParE